MLRGMDVRAAMRRAERAAVVPLLRALRREVGLWGSVRVLSAVALGRARGEPFAVLGAAVDERDRLSRKQCGDVVLLHAVDAAHLMHLFCQVDEHYFRQQDTIVLRRDKTLAKGDACCNFEFSLRRSQPAPLAAVK